MNKRQPGEYKLEVNWNGRMHAEWYHDKSRAEKRKEELENYRDNDNLTSSPFTNVKIKFVPENEIPTYRE